MNRADDLLARVQKNNFTTPNVPPRKRRYCRPFVEMCFNFHSRSDESLPTSSKSIKLESPSLFESPWSDQSGFEAAVAANQKYETPKISAKMTKPRKIEQSANNAFTLSSDDEEPSPVLVRNPVVQENEPDIRPKRCKGKKYF